MNPRPKADGRPQQARRLAHRSPAGAAKACLAIIAIVAFSFEPWLLKVKLEPQATNELLSGNQNAPLKDRERIASQVMAENFPEAKVVDDGKRKG